LAGYGWPLVLDWSAYARVLLAASSSGRRLSRAAVQLFEEGVLADELYVCPPFRLEARYSATSAENFAAIDHELDGFRQILAGDAVWELADRAQATLARTPGVSHRVKLPDLLVAACAAHAGAGVLHYDKDYDTLAKHAELEFESVWIAPGGTVD
jgi:predicted nucleic acid-binding protein